MIKLSIKKVLALSVICISNLIASPTLTIASGSTGSEIEFLKKDLALYEKEYGQKVKIVTMPSSTTDQLSQYKLWLSAKDKNIDVYNVDVIWAPQIGNHLVDLKPYTKDIINKHFPSIIETQTVNNRLIALPMNTDAPALYYRSDLLEKYNIKPPRTWSELTKAAKFILEKEKNKKLQGFVWQGSAYEGLTCVALEWVKSFGGGQIVEPNGDISINNKNAIKALSMAKTWIGTISPEGVLAYKEEEERGVWQVGDAIFMRNWPYAYALGNSKDSKIKGKFKVIPLPTSEVGGKSAATLGGWNLAVSKYSQHRADSIRLVKFLASKKLQKNRALKQSKLPSIISLYKDSEIIKKVPIIPMWEDVFKNSVPRPSAPTKKNYNEVSKEFYSTVHNILSDKISPKKGLSRLEKKLKRIKRGSW